MKYDYKRPKFLFSSLKLNTTTEGDKSDLRAAFHFHIHCGAMTTLHLVYQVLGVSTLSLQEVSCAGTNIK